MSKEGIPSRELAKWINKFNLLHCPEKDVREVSVRILDLLISAVAGWNVNRQYSEKVSELFFGWSGKDESTVFFHAKRLPAPVAAYLNATYAHGADLDDGHRTANGHPGVAIIPAVLALAEAEGSTRESLYESIIVGYETYIRLSNVVQPGLLKRGFHGTGIVGAVAASAACSKLLGLNEEEIHNAISLGAIQASGLFEVSESGQMTKPVNPANACRTGVESALMARKGIRAPERPFDGAKGFYKAFSDRIAPEELLAGLGESLNIGTCYIKLSPACRHTHPCIDAGVELRGRREIRSEEIQKIDIFTYENAAFVTGKIAKPRNEDEAKFSMKYALAMALRRGQYSFPELKGARAMDVETGALIDKMEIIVDPVYESRREGIRGCKVVIHYNDNTEDSSYIPVPRGESVNPLRAEDLREKMRICCQGFWSEAKQEELYHCIMETEFRLTNLMELAAAGGEKEC